MFLHVCVCPQGGHAWQAGGHAWWGGMHGEACVVGGHAWGGMCGRGHAWWGACVAGGMVGGMHGGVGVCVAGGHVCHGRYHGIRSMSGRYASYWNAFLFLVVLRITSLSLDQAKKKPSQACRLYSLSCLVCCVCMKQLFQKWIHW